MLFFCRIADLDANTLLSSSFFCFEGRSSICCLCYTVSSKKRSGLKRFSGPEIPRIIETGESRIVTNHGRVILEKLLTRKMGIRPVYKRGQWVHHQLLYFAVNNKTNKVPRLIYRNGFCVPTNFALEPIVSKREVGVALTEEAFSAWHHRLGKQFVNKICFFWQLVVEKSLESFEIALFYACVLLGRLCCFSWFYVESQGSWVLGV